ncbi:hypothetical protein C8R44DRAFT_826604 [Mycena epipterygia]|nr:hypothetical protein C8R44DRAFT_826604 [Mycena epipterygia]
MRSSCCMVWRRSTRYCAQCLSVCLHRRAFACHSSLPSWILSYYTHIIVMHAFTIHASTTWDSTPPRPPRL